MNGRLLTVSEVAERFQISPAWVRDHAAGRRRPHIPCVRMGKSIRFREADIEEFLRQCAAASKAA